MRIQYIRRNGAVIRLSFNKDSAYRRLASLEAQERYTREHAPTDSGDVRFNNNAEADAIRAALYPNAVRS